jgi:hydroxyacylglutathione hydrolase/adenylyltransferase/sulfurtransferase
MDADLTPPQVAQLLADSDVQLIDVRQQYEVDAGRIAGSRHIELAVLASQAESIDRDRPIVFVCRSGARSGMATDAFRGAGYDAHNLAGGLLEWQAAGLPLEPDGGYVSN